MTVPSRRSSLQVVTRPVQDQYFLRPLTGPGPGQARRRPTPRLPIRVSTAGSRVS